MQYLEKVGPCDDAIAMLAVYVNPNEVIVESD